jgi:D-alanine-D-alanine ligase
MRVAILHDDVLARTEASPDELGVLEAVEAVALALAELGHEVARIAATPRVERWAAELLDAGPGLVFNLCEGVAGASAGEVHAAGVVQLLGLPMTGSPADTLALARRKDRVNALLAAAGVAVPAWTLADRLNGWHRFPAIVKPAAEDASVGITQASVTPDDASLRRAVAESRHRPLLVQEFLPGRELNVGIVGPLVLPVAEIEFTALPAGGWPLVSYRAKWEQGSDEDLATTPRCPARLDEATAAEARSLARAAWSIVDGRGYGRVDLRADAEGRLHVLEVNPNPDLAPSAGLARMAATEGWSYVELIRHIVEEAA